MFYLAICLFVYLLATSHKDLWLVLHENFTREVSLDKEVTVEFCKSYLGIFLKEFLSLWLFVGWGNSAYFADSSRSVNKFLWNFWGVGCLTSNKLISMLIRIALQILECFNRIFQFSMVVPIIRILSDQEPWQRFVLSWVLLYARYCLSIPSCTLCLSNQLLDYPYFFICCDNLEWRIAWQKTFPQLLMLLVLSKNSPFT